jgi:hypothetical protein
MSVFPLLVVRFGGCGSDGCVLCASRKPNRTIVSPTTYETVGVSPSASHPMSSTNGDRTCRGHLGIDANDPQRSLNLDCTRSCGLPALPAKSPRLRPRVRQSIDRVRYCIESSCAFAVFRSEVSKPSLKRSYTDCSRLRASVIRP